jgi:hypothetical protein
MVPPLRARTCEPSTAQSSRSSESARRSSVSRTQRRRGQTPASVQSRSRRQAVTPEQPTVSAGTSRQATPVRSTYGMPARAALSGTRSRPGWRWRRSRAGGSSGATRSRRSSGTRSARTRTPCRSRSSSARPAAQLILKRSVSTPTRGELPQSPMTAVGFTVSRWTSKRPEGGAAGGRGGNHRIPMYPPPSICAITVTVPSAQSAAGPLPRRINLPVGGVALVVACPVDRSQRCTTPLLPYSSTSMEMVPPGKPVTWNEQVGAGGPGFVAAGRAAVEHEPSVGPLDHPPVWYRGEPPGPGPGLALSVFHVDVEAGGVLDEVLAVAAVDPCFADLLEPSDLSVDQIADRVRLPQEHLPAPSTCTRRSASHPRRTGVRFRRPARERGRRLTPVARSGPALPR